MDFHLWDLKPSVTTAMKNIYSCLHILGGGAFGRKRAFNPTSFSTASLNIIYYTQEEKEENVKI